MLIAALLLIAGIVVIIINPIFGLIPGILLIVASIIVGVLALLGKGIGAILSIGSKKTCPECRSEIPTEATVCRVCGYRYH
jgi:UPF0716 family protein affecting phage T7 exclusion